MKLYVYTPTSDAEGMNWDDAMSQGLVEVVATIEGNDQTELEKYALAHYSDPDRFGWTYQEL